MRRAVKVCIKPPREFGEVFCSSPASLRVSHLPRSHATHRASGTEFQLGGRVSYVSHLECRECQKTYAAEPLAACEECWAPLEVVYDYGRLCSDVRREEIAAR